MIPMIDHNMSQIWKIPTENIKTGGEYMYMYIYNNEIIEMKCRGGIRKTNKTMTNDQDEQWNTLTQTKIGDTTHITHFWYIKITLLW